MASRPPVTIERLEVYLNFLGGLMVDHSPEFDSLLPIYERLEQEIEDRRKSVDKMSLIRERVKQSRDRTGAAISASQLNATP